MSDTPKRFDEWEEVDCNQCERYWLNQCDGVTPRKTHEKGSKMPCSSFLATRKVVIPLKLKEQEKAITRLRVCVSLLSVAILLLAVSQIIGG